MAAYQDPPSLGFFRQEHWSRLPFPSPMHKSEKSKWSRSVVSDLSDPMDCSLPGSSFHGIFQAGVLQWGAIAFSGWLPLVALKKTFRNLLRLSGSKRLKTPWLVLTISLSHLFSEMPLKGTQHLYFFSCILAQLSDQNSYYKAQINSKRYIKPSVVTLRSNSSGTPWSNFNLSAHFPVSVPGAGY